MAPIEPFDAERDRARGGPSLVTFIVIVGIIVVIVAVALLLMGGQVSRTFGGVGDSV